MSFIYRSCLSAIPFLYLGMQGVDAVVSSTYQLDTQYSGSTFFDGFDFWSGPDPTDGYVSYQDKATGFNHGLWAISWDNKALMGVDHTSVLDPLDVGRESIRISTKKTWTHGLFIVDIDHMPGTICGSWPAFWSFGPNWPAGGEIDIIEGVNSQILNLVSLHTTPSCKAQGPSQGGFVESNCVVGESYGCSYTASSPNQFGTPFNNIEGGVFATDWTSNYIRVYFFPRGAIPADIQNGTPDPSTWGTPQANFMPAPCDIDAHFYNHQFVFDTTFCGDWAGSVWQWDACLAKAPTCQQYVAANPTVFRDAYWSIRSLKVYKFLPVPTPTPTPNPTPRTTPTPTPTSTRISSSSSSALRSSSLVSSGNISSSSITSSSSIPSFSSSSQGSSSSFVFSSIKPTSSSVSSSEKSSSAIESSSLKSSSGSKASTLVASSSVKVSSTKAILSSVVSSSKGSSIQASSSLKSSTSSKVLSSMIVSSSKLSSVTGSTVKSSSAVKVTSTSNSSSNLGASSRKQSSSGGASSVKPSSSIKGNLSSIVGLPSSSSKVSSSAKPSSSQKVSSSTEANSTKASSTSSKTLSSVFQSPSSSRKSSLVSRTSTPLPTSSKKTSSLSLSSTKSILSSKSTPPSTISSTFISQSISSSPKPLNMAYSSLVVSQLPVTTKTNTLFLNPSPVSAPISLSSAQSSTLTTSIPQSTTSNPTSLAGFTYIGCLSSSSGFPSFIEMESSHEMTPSLCISTCSQFTYAAVFKQQCFCSNNLFSTSTKKKGCTARCPGDEQQTCGGSMSNVSGRAIFARGQLKKALFTVYGNSSIVGEMIEKRDLALAETGMEIEERKEDSDILPRAKDIPTRFWGVARGGAQEYPNGFTGLRETEVNGTGAQK